MSQLLKAKMAHPISMQILFSESSLHLVSFMFRETNKNHNCKSYIALCNNDEKVLNCFTTVNKQFYRVKLSSLFYSMDGWKPVWQLIVWNLASKYYRQSTAETVSARQTKDCKDYSKPSLAGLRADINRHLTRASHCRTNNIIKGREFITSIPVLNGWVKKLKEKARTSV